MSAIRVNIEIGHEASMKSKQTPEGFTHDWEVFVRGQEGADISHFVEKVVFKLHETFQKPRRVVKEPPFSIKESGYAGFVLPIEIYLKNRDEPKKITFVYDLTLQHGGFLKDRYIFENPSDEFRRRLLKGGGIVVDKNAFYTNPDQESRSRDSFTDEKQQLISKPKLSSDNAKKHKTKEYKEEPKTSSFENLFGPPIQKPPKVSPDPKKLEKNLTSAKSDKKDKDRSSSDKKTKHEHKEFKTDKLNNKEEKKNEKAKNHNKEQDRIKEKASKRQIERPPSPEPPKKKCPSPSRKLPSPSPRSGSASSMKEEYKTSKHNSDSIEQKKQKSDERIPEIKIEKDTKEKKKKEKKSHDRDKERREKKEHKKESHKIKDFLKEPLKELPKEVAKTREIVKEKEIIKNSPIKEKPLKPEKIKENLRKSPLLENPDRQDNHKSKDKGEPERKHKHKKKDKKKDESKEKHKESSKERKHKHEKVREIPPEKSEIIEHRKTPIQKERPLPEPASPISIDTASQCSSKSGLNKAILIGTEDINSCHSDSEGSMIADEEDIKVKIENPSPKPVKREPSPEPEPEHEPELEIEPEPEPVVEPPPVQQKEKSKKHKDKSKREEKRRKRKAAEEEDAESRKIAKAADSGPSNNETEHGESSGSTSIETKVQDNGVSSSLGEDAEPGDLSPAYMVQLRGLQQRIMMIKNNEDLERVVNLIAETGRYEVTTQTFDFDLCLLDRSTVQQLIQLVGC